MKVKLFTHTDLDGVGCAILGLLTYKDINITYCNYSDVNDIIGRFINDNDYRFYDKIFITDISINKDVANGIDSLVQRDKFSLIDHHETARWLNKYDWCYVVSTDRNKNTSATSLFHEQLCHVLPMYRKLIIREFVNIVREYDTWEWKSNNNSIPLQYNSLFNLLGHELFIENIMEKIESINLELSPSDILLLDIERNRINRYINSKKDNITITTIDKYNVGVVFADQYISELANTLLEYNPHIDILAVVNINNNTISYRTLRDDIHLGRDIASIYNGGGHAKAAGSELYKDIKSKVANIIFNTKNRD